LRILFLRLWSACKPTNLSKFWGNTMSQIFLILIAAIFIPSGIFAETTHFTGVSSTNNFIQFNGTLSINGQNPETGVDEVAVFVDDKNGGEIIVGAVTAGNTFDNYYLISVYADDEATPEKDGASVGDTLIFKVWDNQSNIELTLLENQISIVPTNSLETPVKPLVFQASYGNQFGFLNLNASTIVSGEQIKAVAIPVVTLPGIIGWISLLVGISIYCIRQKATKSGYSG